MKTLIIAEKPDMGRTIAAVVEPKAVNRRTYLEGERYIISWAIGHLVTLAEPDQYDPRYKKWNDQDLPIIPGAFKLWPNARTKDQLKTIGELAKRCNRLINACDAGREGQLIFHYIRQYLKLRQPTDRLWISDLTAETIRKGFDALRSDDSYTPLTKAAKARSEADWLIGMNASRAFTIRHKALLSVGRVQTPVLALLYDRHQEIKAFQSETYYVVRAVFEQEGCIYSGLWQGERLTDPAKAEALAQKVNGKQGQITQYEVTESKEYPFRLYDLTLLQREANARFGFSAKKTLDIAQALYEKHKVITYPRTNSNYVTEENIPVMGKVLNTLQGTQPYSELAAGADRSRVHKGNKAVCNPSKVEDHHAILPTPKRASGLSQEEQKIYDMVVRRFLSHYYPPARYNNHLVITVADHETFRTKAKELLEPGWKVVLHPETAEGSTDKTKGKRKKAEAEPDEEEELMTGPLRVTPEQPVWCKDASYTEKATQPPKAYTEGTLLKAMESAGKSVEEDELREAMKDTGLGTPATRAATIERLKQVGYISLAGKKLEITSKGCAAIELIREAGVELLASPAMTGRWEQRLHQISRGEASDERFMEQVKQFASLIVEKVRVQRPAMPGTFEEESRGSKRSAKRTGTTGKSTGKTGAKQTAAGAGSQRAATASPGTSAAEGTGSVRSASFRSGACSAAAAKSAGSKRAAAAPEQTAGPKRIAACPRQGCGGTIIEGKRGYGCSAFRTGCTFVIWKEQLGKSISAAMAKSLVEKGETSLITFKRPNGGESYKGKLVLADRSKGTIQIAAAVNGTT
ncbi:type IA DNA topoisomerase [Paenibacillus protaetiae]|uniref:DNA topoisomerase n=1 Tax=Paenibacillus protaetiae TaxID=2509456 RepID=A0A4P6EU66_9BACL|nr:type IA DNA topoisomerase [Paenibacillus protaetiae]QAY66015.1 type IA DNA topoisomerase [Paenibacillus protaetiae]